MNLIRNIKYKKGSYLVEAAMLFPIFILAVVILISIIVMIGSCEKIVFSTCQESRLEAFKVGCGQWETDNLIKLKLVLNDENPLADNIYILNHKFYKSENKIKDLIVQDIVVQYPQKIFDLKVKYRKFTGSSLDQSPMDRSEMEHVEEYKKVFIFPSFGERYHSEGCYYLRNADKESKKLNSTYIEIDQEIAIKRGFTPCKICGRSL